MIVWNKKKKKKQINFTYFAFYFNEYTVIYFSHFATVSEQLIICKRDGLLTMKNSKILKHSTHDFSLKKINFQEVLIQLHPDNSNLWGKLKEFSSNQKYELLGVENKGLEIREKWCSLIFFLLIQ